MNLIAIETAGDVCSVAVATDKQVVAELHTDEPRRHAESLVPMIGECLEKAAVPRSGIEAVAVSAGPGSYTGLRIGVSTAKGLAFALKARLIAVPTLEALALGVYSEHPERMGRPVVILAPSRRSEVYAAAFRAGDEYSVARITEDRTLDVADLEAWADQRCQRPFLLSGTALDRAIPAFESGMNDSDPSIEIVSCRPSARFVALIALRRFEQNLFENASSFEPAYLKPFEVRRRRGTAFDRLPF